VYARPWNFPDVEKFIIPSCDYSVSWTFAFAFLFHGEKTSCESREWRWDIVIVPLIHLPAFHCGFRDRRHNILDGFETSLGEVMCREWRSEINWKSRMDVRFEYDENVTVAGLKS
jgi:hypothetical protein